MRLRSATPLLVAALISTFVPVAARAEGGAKINFADNVAAIFRNRCGSCHNPDKAKGG